jgi:hypothetical protein
MLTLRHMTRRTRLVLAVFLLSLGAAIASPAVKPHRLEMVCAGGLFKLVLPEGAGVSPAPSALDCALCFASDEPPAAYVGPVSTDWPADRLPPHLGGHRVVPQAALPPPARAPPAGHAIV